MDPDASNGDVVNLILDSLTGLGLEPRLIPRGSIDELRGGIRCFDLEAGDGVDSAILLSKLDVELYPIEDARTVYKIDYVVRGNIKGVLRGRIISETTPELKGLLRKRLVGLRWKTPKEQKGGSSVYRSRDKGGSPPGQGELWDGGPHMTLTERLNRDPDLIKSLKTLTSGEGGAPPNLTVFSDGWGESVRIRGHPWLRARDLPAVYTAPSYLWIVSRIGRHVKEVRRRFGGLTF